MCLVKYAWWGGQFGLVHLLVTHDCKLPVRETPVHPTTISPSASDTEVYIDCNPFSFATCMYIVPIAYMAYSLAECSWSKQETRRNRVEMKRIRDLKFRTLG